MTVAMLAGAPAVLLVALSWRWRCRLARARRNLALDAQGRKRVGW